MRAAARRFAHLIPLVLLAGPLLGQVTSPGGRAQVAGTVTAQGRPLAGVLVMRLGSGDSTRSDSLGRYVLPGLGAGHHIFEVRKRGFSPLEMEIIFPNDTLTVRADIPMEPAGAADPALVDKLNREGFSERRRNARERDRLTFLGPEDIEAREAVKVSQLFDGAQGVTVRFENGISVLYGGDGHCVMFPWIEHQLIETAFPPASTGPRGPTSLGGSGGGSRRSTTRYTGLDDLIPIGQIAAIEIYPRAGQVPQEFQRSGQQASTSGRGLSTESVDCGAVIFWTR
ncbi:MAG: carboxypeptidase-like regulatory domain-containing protein [Gemmatimonadales bacterium]